MVDGATPDHREAQEVLGVPEVRHRRAEAVVQGLRHRAFTFGGELLAVPDRHQQSLEHPRIMEVAVVADSA